MLVASVSSNIQSIAPVFAQIPIQDAAANRRLSTAVKALNAADLAGPKREFVFTIDPKTKRGIVRIIDIASRQVLDQLPHEYVLEAAQQLQSEIPSRAAAADR